MEKCKCSCIWPVASPRFVARRGKAGNYVMGHSRRTSGSGAADCPMTDSFVTNVVLIKESELLTSAPADLADYITLG